MKKVTALADYERVKEYVAGYYREYGEVPTLRPTAEAVGISKSAVGRYMREMENEGFLYKQEEWRYGWADEKYPVRGRRIPVVGSVSCGLRKLATEEISDYLVLPEDNFNPYQDYFVLTADGDSMIDAGIDSGDYVIIRQQETADPGQIVVALDGDGEATLKRFYPHLEEGTVELRPENETMESQFIDLKDGERLMIQGVAVKVVKVIDLN